MLNATLYATYGIMIVIRISIERALYRPHFCRTPLTEPEGHTHGVFVGDLPGRAVTPNPSIEMKEMCSRVCALFALAVKFFICVSCPFESIWHLHTLPRVFMKLHPTSFFMNEDGPTADKPYFAPYAHKTQRRGSSKLKSYLYHQSTSLLAIKCDSLDWWYAAKCASHDDAHTQTPRVLQTL